ncbi:MAG TPA: HAMP domain-containing sensor histidine kinase [Nannocystaceae bacterium]|nr:HAMP domain-containing sensor histidine kinase [Nannocystaceae bacterium]
MSTGDDSGELARRVAHAIRTPMGVVGGVLDQLRDGNANIDRTRLLELADRGLAQIGRLADRLGMLGAIERGLEARKQPTELRALVETAIADIARSRRRRGIEVVLAPGLDASVSCDAAIVRAAIAELVDNAVRFAKASVTVEVDAAAGKVTVGNDGPAIDPAVLVALAGTRTTPADRAGLGIGLWIAGRILATHGGSIDHSRAGDVTSFCVSLDAAA